MKKMSAHLFECVCVCVRVGRERELEVRGKCQRRFGFITLLITTSEQNL